INILELTDLPVEPLCYTPDEFDLMRTNQNSFVMIALEEGIELFPRANFSMLLYESARKRGIR
ncbi:MAG: hypothetical protein V1862_03865, partial [Methanobacteriota archaeon]